MLNKVVLIGRLVKDPNELRKSEGGASVSSFTLAVDNSYSKESKADFIPVIVFNRLAEFTCSYLRKGALISVEGRLQQRSYQNKEGATVYVIEVAADNIQTLESKEVRESRLNSSNDTNDVPF